MAVVSVVVFVNGKRLNGTNTFFLMHSIVAST